MRSAKRGGDATLTHELCLSSFSQEASPGADSFIPIAAWRPLLQDISDNFIMPATGQEHRPQPGPHKPSPPQVGTHFSIPNRRV